MNKRTRVLASIYFKITMVIATVVFLASAGQLFIASEAIKSLGQEAEQQIFWETASEIAKGIQQYSSPVMQPAEIEKHIFELSRFDPNLSAYILDEHGVIVFNYPVHAIPRRREIPLEILHRAVATESPDLPILGPNPLDFRKDGALFSAARLELNERPGFVYVVFTEPANRLLMRNGQFVVTRIALVSSFIIGLAAILIGLGLFYFTTRRFRHFIDVLRAFSAGDFKPRVDNSVNDEISEIGRAINSLADSVITAQAKLEERDQTRRELLANISHDLRSPVTVLRARLDIVEEAIERGSADSALSQFSALHRSGDALERLITDLFELSKLEAHAVVKKQNVSLVELLADVREQLQVRSDEYSVKITIENEGCSSTETAFVDPQLIERLLINLIENALRYSPAGTQITLRIKVETQWTIEVEDNGSGIEPAVAANIFKRGERSADSRGAGLGLAICFAIARLHEGTISHFEAAHGGTIFRISLPRDTSAIANPSLFAH